MSFQVPGFLNVISQRGIKRSVSTWAAGQSCLGPVAWPGLLGNEQSDLFGTTGPCGRWGWGRRDGLQETEEPPGAQAGGFLSRLPPPPLSLTPHSKVAPGHSGLSRKNFTASSLLLPRQGPGLLSETHFLLAVAFTSALSSWRGGVRRPGLIERKRADPAAYACRANAKPPPMSSSCTRALALRGLSHQAGHQRGADSPLLRVLPM